jgi:hypothetical protein
MALMTSHWEPLAREAKLRSGAFDPGSTNLGLPGEDGLPSGAVTCLPAGTFIESLSSPPRWATGNAMTREVNESMNVPAPRATA